MVLEQGALTGKYTAPGVVTRPSTAAGARYDGVSNAYFTVVRQALSGRKTTSVAIADLERELQRLTSAAY